MPKYTHDCEHCQFLGTFFDHDVYVCKRGEGWLDTTIIGRYGDDGPKYASGPLGLFIDALRRNSFIGVDGKSVKFHDYLFSQHVCPYHKAWVVALLAAPIPDAVQPVVRYWRQ